MGCREIRSGLLMPSLILVVGIVQAALVRREGGVVCLPAPNIVPAAIGMTLDLGLDIFLIYRAIRLFLKSEEDQKYVEMIVVASTAVMSIWHFVYLINFLTDLRVLFPCYSGLPAQEAGSYHTAFS